MRPRDLLVAGTKSLSGKVRAPGSKSVSHRALVIASIANGTSVLRNVLNCADTMSTIEGLKNLGIKVYGSDDEFKVDGRGGEYSAPAHAIDLGNSGTSLRFLTTLAGLSKGKCVLTGDESLRSRPMGELLACLNDLGVAATSVEGNGRAPVEIQGRGRIPGGKANITGAVSSQFISSLLIPSPYFEKGLNLRVTGQLKSAPYVDLTREVMADFHVTVVRKGQEFHVEPGQCFSPREYDVDGDYSSSSFLMLAGAITGSKIEIGGLKKGSHQADEVFLSILQGMGCKVGRRGDTVSVEGGDLVGLEVDLSDSPDLLPPVSVLGALAKGPSRITGVEHARHKESDRISAMYHELKRLGIRVDQRQDGLELHGGDRPRGTEAFSWGDHRIAMALAVLALASGGLIVRGASSISISYPRFHKDMTALGAKMKWL